MRHEHATVAPKVGAAIRPSHQWSGWVAGIFRFQNAGGGFLIRIWAGSGGLAEGIPAKEEPRMGKMVSTGARWEITTTVETKGSRATRTIPWCCLRQTAL